MLRIIVWLNGRVNHLFPQFRPTCTCPLCLFDLAMAGTMAGCQDHVLGAFR